MPFGSCVLLIIERNLLSSDIRSKFLTIQSNIAWFLEKIDGFSHGKGSKERDYFRLDTEENILLKSGTGAY